MRTIAALGIAVFFSLQAGAQWKSQCPFQLNTLNDVTIVEDSVFLAVGYSGTLLRSIDSGATWIQAAPGLHRGLYSVRFLNGAFGIAVGDSGTAFKSTDRGRTWVPLATGVTASLSSVSIVDTAFAVAAGEGGAIRRTTNGGATWGNLPSPTSGGISAIAFTNRDTGFIAAGTMAEYRTTNGGSTWTNLSWFGSNAMTTISFVDRDTGFMAGGPILARTTNAGVDWSAKYSGMTGEDFSKISMGSGGIGAAVGGEHGMNPKGFVATTTDGGESWQKIYARTSHALSGIAAGKGNVQCAVGEGGVVLLSNDAGRTWNPPMGVTTDLYDVCFPDSRNGWAVGDFGVIIHTTDAGLHWSRQASGMDTTIFLPGVSFPTPSTGIAVSSDKYILRTTDAGATWTHSAVNEVVFFTNVAFSGTDTGFAVGAPDIVLRTTDRGISWSTGHTGLTNQVTDVAMAGGMIACAATGIGGIIRTSDGGATWTSVLQDNRVFISKVAFAGKNTGVAIGGTTVYRSTDAGLSWNPLPAGLGTMGLSVHFGDALHGVIGGAQGVIFQSTDGGATWVNQSIASATSWTLASFRGAWCVGAAVAVLVGTDGAILRTDNAGGLTSVDRVSVAAPAHIALWQNYPNPFNPSTIIRYDIPERSHVTLKVFNALGQQVAVLSDGVEDAGRHEVRLDGSRLSSGVYFYVLRTGQATAARKLVILR